MYTKVFAALPHVNEIWVTEDGHFHLHPHNGGKHILREEIESNEENDNSDQKVIIRRGRPKN